MASHLAWRCLMLLDTIGTPHRNGVCPWRWRASRSRSAGSYPRSCVPRNFLRTSMSDTLRGCLLAPPLVCIAGWSDCILGGIGVVLPKISSLDHRRTFLVDDDSSALGSIHSRWSWRRVHTRGRGSRWQGDARRGMCHWFLLLPKCGDAISVLPPTFCCLSCLLSQIQILEGAAPIVWVVVWPLSRRASILRPHDQCRLWSFSPRCKARTSRVCRPPPEALSPYSYS